MPRLLQFVFAIVMLVAGAVGLAMTACGGYFFLSFFFTDAFQLSVFALVSIGLGAMLISAAWQFISKIMSRDNTGPRQD